MTTARPIDEYHDDMGPVLWWKFPITEEPYVGSPGDTGYVVEAETVLSSFTQIRKNVQRIMVGGWPGYHTHWTPIVIPSEPQAKTGHDTNEQ
jgi:hypothetical protein